MEILPNFAGKLDGYMVGREPAVLGVTLFP